jgi:hypothetical protein
MFEGIVKDRVNFWRESSALALSWSGPKPKGKKQQEANIKEVSIQTGSNSY